MENRIIRGPASARMVTLRHVKQLRTEDNSYLNI